MKKKTETLSTEWRQISPIKSGDLHPDDNFFHYKITLNILNPLPKNWVNDYSLIDFPRITIDLIIMLIKCAVFQRANFMRDTET